MSHKASGAARPIQHVPEVEAAPFVKVAGGKRGLLHKLVPMVPEKFGTYFEPFAGGAAFFWALSNAGRIKSGARLSDTCEPLVRAYEAVTYHPDRLIELLAGARNESAYYYHVRSLGFDADVAEVGARYIFLNKTCFNGLSRFSLRKNEFNVPFGSFRRPTICDAPRIRACHRALVAAGAVVDVCSFERTCALATEGDLVYADPPYHPLDGKDSFVGYHGVGFGRGDQARLRDALLDLKRRGVHVIASNSATPYVRELYEEDFEIEVVHAPRAINSDAGGRGLVEEYVIT